jgi:hypothetical protein
MEEKTKVVLEKVREAACIIGKATGEAVEIAAKKTGEAIEATKLSINNFELKTDIEVLYKEIGKMIYLTHLGLEIDPMEIELKLSLIDEKNEKIELNEKKKKGV